jgi:hypothetical protein
MSAYSITTTRKPRGFTVADAAGTVLASLVQPSYFSQDMVGTVGSSTLRIAGEGFWRMRQGVFLAGARIGGIRTTAWGHLQWTLALPDKPVVVLQFASAAWRYRYYVRLAKDLPLLELRPKSKWAMYPTFEVEVVGAGIAPEQMPLMLALAGYSARLKKARAHAAGGA